MLAAAGPINQAAAADPVRARAEELATEASRRFTQVLGAEVDERDELRSAAGARARRGALLEWLSHSDRSYRALMGRLARPSVSAGPATSAAAARSEAVLARDVASGEEGAGRWLMRSRQLLDGLLRVLAGAPRRPAAQPIGPAEAVIASVPSSSHEEVPGSAGGPPALGQGDLRADTEGGQERPLAMTRRAPPPQPAASAAGPAPGAAAQGAPGPVDTEVASARESAREHVAKRAAPGGPARKGAVARARPHPGGGARSTIGGPPGSGHHPGVRAKPAIPTRHAKAGRCGAAGRKVTVPGWYVVAKGDTLWRIARRHYGAGHRYGRIAAANRTRLRSSDYILPCQRLYVPRPVRRS